MKHIFVVMGVSGSGKTAVGAELARRIDGVFVDADDYHSSANREKMRAGMPLTDEDRAPWLARLRAVLQRWSTAHTRGVLACSALKASYRLALGLPTPHAQLVYLDVPRALLEARLRQRQHAFMPPSLLASQIATLEIPEDALRVTNDRPLTDVVDEILRAQ